MHLSSRTSIVYVHGLSTTLKINIGNEVKYKIMPYILTCTGVAPSFGSMAATLFLFLLKSRDKPPLVFGL